MKVQALKAFRDVRFISTDALATHLDDYIHKYKTRRNSTNLKGPEPSSIPDPGPRGFGSYLANPISGPSSRWFPDAFYCNIAQLSDKLLTLV